MAVRIKKSLVLKGIILFVLFSVGVMVGILIWTTKSETWQQLLHFKWTFIPIVITFGILRWYLDGMAFVTMAKHGSKSPLRVNRAAEIRLEGNLISHLLPVLVGVFSHVYLLYKEKMKISEAFAITSLRATLPVFFFLLNIPILLFMKEDPDSSKFFGEFIQLISIPIVIIVILFIITLFYPSHIKKGASKFVRWCGKIKILNIEKIITVEERLFHEIDQYSDILWTYLKKKKHMLFRASGWIFLAFLADYFIAISIIWGFGYHPPLLRALLIQFLMRPIIFFAPTPGGTGIWDFTYLGFFSMFLPQYLIGVGVLLWRLMLTYIPVVVGSIILTRDIRADKKMRKIILEQGKISQEMDAIEKEFE